MFTDDKTDVNAVTEMQHVGLLSTHRSGRHWLLSGVFNTVKLPQNTAYQQYQFPFANCQSQLCVKIINNKIFTAGHERLEPYKPTDRYIFLDRKDKEAQALSFARLQQHKIHAIYCDKEAAKVKKFISSIKISKDKIRLFVKNEELLRKNILQSLANTDYRIYYYEDLVQDYEKTVLAVIYYLFDLDLPYCAGRLSCKLS